MKRILSLLTLSAFLFIVSCGAEKQPAPAAIESKNVLAELRDIRRAYERKDRADFMKEVADSYKDRQALSTSVEGVFSKFESVKFNVQYAKMVIMIEEKGVIRATFNWDGEWQAKGDLVQKDGGRVTMVFEPGSFKLMSIEGKNPFVPQAGEMPGMTK